MLFIIRLLIVILSSLLGFRHHNHRHRLSRYLGTEHMHVTYETLFEIAKKTLVFEVLKALSFM